ncbi:hypothetical protein F5878DRAFT_509525, partial [Lentinula raphanica]
LLVKYGFHELKPKSTPLPNGVILTLDQSPKTDEDRDFMKDKPYAEILGGVQF